MATLRVRCFRWQRRPRRIWGCGGRSRHRRGAAADGTRQVEMRYDPGAGAAAAASASVLKTVSTRLAQGYDLPALTQSGHRNAEKRVLHREVRHTIRGAKLVGLVKVFKRALAKGSVP